jgi:hypothetical protein
VVPRFFAVFFTFFRKFFFNLQTGYLPRYTNCFRGLAAQNSTPEPRLVSSEVVPKLKSWDWFKQNGSRRVLVLSIGQTPERWSRS